MIITSPSPKAKSVLAKTESSFMKTHKLFLYKEDFEKFPEGLNEAVAHIKSNCTRC
jgi:hypothetical protein